jgi:mono/diheme cytochrome c family protein
MKYFFSLVILLPFLSFSQAKKKLPASSAQGAALLSLARGKAVYLANCLSCHQADGGGVPNLNPPLQRTKWTTGPASTIIKMVLEGSKGKVEIDEETFNNTMPVQAHLTDQQIADVLTYVRKNFGNNASAVTPAEVKAIRAKSKK